MDHAPDGIEDEACGIFIRGLMGMMITSVMRKQADMRK
jgi:hypothetical protein